jgi:hypothetical protein
MLVMTSKNVQYLLTLLFITGSFISCEKEDPISDSAVVEDQVQSGEDVTSEEKEEEPLYPRVGETGDILVYDEAKVASGLLLVNDAGADRVYLKEKATGNIVHEWSLQYNLGNDVELLPNGQLLASLAADAPAFTFGGYGGKIQIIEPDGTVVWDFDYASEEYLAHHDVEMLPNGNVLMLVWEAKTLAEAREYGYEEDVPFVYPESLIEVDINSKEIVWRWDSWDHLVQESDPSKKEYDVVQNRPERINLNFVDEDRKEVIPDGDFMHANGFDYDADRDIIFLSVNFYSEVWVIDHSTTTEEAKTSTGGKYGKGGDLIYRFGNPTAYNSEEPRLFLRNHFPNLLEDGEPGEGNMLIFVNGSPFEQESMVYELDLPETFDMENSPTQPEVIWSFGSQDLYSPKVSGAIRLENGNTLITSGSKGFWEVTPEKEVVWQFKGDGFYWRGYHYSLDSPALQSLGL